jgi:L-fuconolactonase
LWRRCTTESGLPADPKIMTEKIDAHHHLWRYQAADFSWINDSMAVLKRDFLPADLEQELHSAGLSGSVAVQARQTLAETTWLLELASKSRTIRGVVGWAPLASSHVAADLEHLPSQSKLKGLRHIVQDEPDDNFILGSNFNQGVSSLKNSGLVYDILIFEKHLPAAIQFVDRHPGQVFVLDHIAKPKIRERLLQPWTKHIGELARRENVFCKLSGMVTEADWKHWTEADLKPYMDVVLQTFGPKRLMAGSDWPVCLVATSYKKWFDVLRSLLGELSESERERVFGETAREVYRLG